MNHPEWLAKRITKAMEPKHIIALVKKDDRLRSDMETLAKFFAGVTGHSLEEMRQHGGNLEKIRARNALYFYLKYEIGLSWILVGEILERSSQACINQAKVFKNEREVYPEIEKQYTTWKAKMTQL
jgi:hypothetical protein